MELLVNKTASTEKTKTKVWQGNLVRWMNLNQNFMASEAHSNSSVLLGSVHSSFCALHPSRSALTKPPVLSLLKRSQTLSLFVLLLLFAIFTRFDHSFLPEKLSMVLSSLQQYIRTLDMEADTLRLTPYSIPVEWAILNKLIHPCKPQFLPSSKIQK